MVAVIYKPAKTAMQSGRRNTREWVLRYEPEAPREREPLMGWTSSGDMKQQLRLNFPTQDDAIAYCERNNIAYRLRGAHQPKRHKKTYADNFKYGRLGTWTH